MFSRSDFVWKCIKAASVQCLVIVTVVINRQLSYHQQKVRWKNSDGEESVAEFIGTIVFLHVIKMPIINNCRSIVMWCDVIYSKRNKTSGVQKGFVSDRKIARQGLMSEIWSGLRRTSECQEMIISQVAFIRSMQVAE